MHIIRTPQDLRTILASLRHKGKVAFVPTMGALHEGHLSLITQAKQVAQLVVASIFVNPKQFGAGEDLASYPRPEMEDLKKLEASGVDVAYLPSAEAMYQPGASTHISVDGVSAGLCGAKRPGHFDGVALVVTKLLLQVLPDIAIFGEKDYQQLQVIKRLVRDLDIPVEILSGAIFREADGLAMSSRNLYLNQEERQLAPVLYQTLLAIKAGLVAGKMLEEMVADASDDLRAKGFTKVDYIELRDAETLEVVATASHPARLLIAAYLGKCRLIDNIAV